MSNDKEHVGDKPVPIDWKNWRATLASGESTKPVEQKWTKFTEKKKAIYLECLERHGQKMLAARQADIGFTTLLDHREEDLQFAAAEEVVLELRSQRIVEQLEKEALEGHTSFHYDKDGNLLQEKKVLETPLRLAMMKRHGEGYVEKSAVDVTTNGNQVGAVVVPAGVPVEDWEKLYGSKSDGSKQVTE